jgi:hypothetical protein
MNVVALGLVEHRPAIASAHGAQPWAVTGSGGAGVAGLLADLPASFRVMDRIP